MTPEMISKLEVSAICWDAVKVNMMQKFLLMNLSILISNLSMLKLSKTKPSSRYSHLKIMFLHKKCPGIWVEFLDL